ncbi:MAG: hypothetical protein A2X12_05885 [Bacteroidetes bacterium GWE2_29_8]|nr:MAG: hypothetical protein A2X12_05885 [Bacteroidetes bacterium GWE2_29_8]OFY18747.1 MAG: hypothetical protein A2X02_04350 [Bacteroidetes bacterium GWF2_29_10]
MISHSKIKLIRSLDNKKSRKEFGLFVVEGEKIVKELIDNNNYNIQELYALPEWILQNEKLINDRNLIVFDVNSQTLTKISNLNSPNKVLALVNQQSKQIDLKLLVDKITLMLDDINDPGNLGTIIRIADWFGIENIICSKDTVDFYNPKVIQATMGSFARINVYYTDLMNFIKQNNSFFNLYGSFIEGENIYKTELKENSIIIMGNESRGISEVLKPYIANKINIPLYNSNTSHAESLNVAIATGIICAEFRRINN